MSYILDALKKSEQERKLGHLPDLSSDHLPLQSQESRSLIIKLSIITGTLLVFLLLLFVYFYFDNNTAAIKTSQNIMPGYEKQRIDSPKHLDLTYSAQQDFINTDANTFAKNHPVAENQMEVIHPDKSRREQLIKQKQTEQNQDAALKKKYEQYFKATEQKSSVTLENKDQQENIRDAAKRRMQEALQTSDQTPVEQNPEESMTKNSEGKSISETAEESEGDATKLEPAKEEDAQYMLWEDYPSIAELSKDIQEQLPALHVSTHIFSSAESFRKVTINDQSLKKGAELSPGLLLQDISEEGVILSFKGVWFRMKALENWQK